MCEDDAVWFDTVLCEDDGVWFDKVLCEDDAVWFDKVLCEDDAVWFDNVLCEDDGVCLHDRAIRRRGSPGSDKLDSVCIGPMGLYNQCLVK